MRTYSVLGIKVILINKGINIWVVVFLYAEEISIHGNGAVIFASKITQIHISDFRKT